MSPAASVAASSTERASLFAAVAAAAAAAGEGSAPPSPSPAALFAAAPGSTSVRAATLEIRASETCEPKGLMLFERRFWLKETVEREGQREEGRTSTRERSRSGDMSLDMSIKKRKNNYISLTSAQRFPASPGLQARIARMPKRPRNLQRVRKPRALAKRRHLRQRRSSSLCSPRAIPPLGGPLRPAGSLVRRLLPGADYEEFRGPP